MLRRSLAASVCALALVAAACRSTPSGPNDPSCVRVEDGHGPAGTVPIVVDTVVTGLEVPWGIAFLPSGAWLVTERPGRIRVVRSGRLSPPIAEVPIARGGEGGLLGIALDPKFSESSFFYVYFTAEKNGRDVNRIERWKLAPDLSSATRDRAIWGCERRDGMVSPRISWKEAAPPGGAAIYRGDAIPEWKGSLLVGTLRSEHLLRITLSPNGTKALGHERYLSGKYGRLREVVMGPDGHLYVTTSNCDGRGDCSAEKDRILRIRR